MVGDIVIVCQAVDEAEEDIRSRIRDALGVGSCQLTQIFYEAEVCVRLENLNEHSYAN